MLRTQIDHFGNALTFVLLGHLPVAQHFFCAVHLMLVLLETLGVVRGDTFHLGLEARVVLRLAGFEVLQLLLLAGFVGIQGLLAPVRVLQQLLR